MPEYHQRQGPHHLSPGVYTAAWDAMRHSSQVEKKSGVSPRPFWRQTMSSLTSILAFAHGGGSLLPPKDAHIHVSDTLDAHGVFVLLQYAIKALQDARPVVWVSARADGPTHLAHIARKAVRWMILTQGHFSGYPALCLYRCYFVPG